MMKLLGIALVLAAGVMTGCSSLSCGDPHPYLNSGVTPPLKAPAGLSVPPPDPAYAIAGVTAGSAGKRTDLNAAGACLISPPQVVPSASGGSVKPTVSPGAATARPSSAAPTEKSESAAKPAAGTPVPAPAAATSRFVPEA